MASSKNTSKRTNRSVNQPLPPRRLASNGLRLALFFMAIALCGAAVGYYYSRAGERTKAVEIRTNAVESKPGRTTTSPVEKNTSAATSASSAALPVVPASVTQTDFQTLDGGSLRLASYAGKVVVLDLWATWCGPCRQEIPHLVELSKDYKDRGVEVIGLSTEDPASAAQKVRDFAGEFKIDYTLGWADGALASNLMQGNGSIPQTFVITRDGRLMKRLIGFNPLTGPAQLREAVEQAVSLSSAEQTSAEAKSATQPLPPDGVRRFTPEELRDALARGEAIALDVRPASQYKAGHIPGALWIPDGEINKRVNEVPRDKLIVTYCS